MRRFHAIENPLMRFFLVVLLANLSLPAQGAEPTRGDVAMAHFARVCAARVLDSGLPPGHRLGLIYFAVTLRNEQYALLETPYISGAPHARLHLIMEKEVGPVGNWIMVGEAEYNEEGRIVALLDTSGWAFEEGIESHPDRFVEILRDVAPEVLAPGRIRIETYSQVQHLDGRLRSTAIANVRHDAIDNAVVAFGLHSQCLSNEDNSLSVETMSRLSPIVRLYSEMLREEGHDTSELTSLLDKLDRKQTIPPADGVRVATLLRRSHAGHRSYAENLATVRIRTWAVKRSTSPGEYYPQDYEQDE